MDEQKNTNLRPPIVTIMGHVDHGKTTLLDTIRKTNIVAGEHGGITQHIGAYQITFQDKLITFVDTPGHAAFEKMRSRGAEVADIVVLVVAANDGIKPQTTEAIKHIKKANKPIIVAITKTDLPDINIDKVKKELQSKDILIESYGGDVPVVEVAAPKGKGITDLLEIIELVWQISPETSQKNAELEAVVVESFMDKNRGSIASVIVKKGTLKVGQKIQVDNEVIGVKALIDDNGNNIKEAEPSKPVEILGFKKNLEVGSVIYENNTTSSQIKKAATFEDILARTQEHKDKFKVIIKADVLGSLEAILSNLPEKILVVSSTVGEIQSTDINLAKITQSPIIGFNVKVSGSVKAQADREGVVIRIYKVIYELISDLEDIATSFEEAKQELKIQGVAKVVASFVIDGKKIAGCQITKGKFKIGDTIHAKSHGGRDISETTITSLKKFKKDIDSISAPGECGICFNANLDFNVGDIIESLGQIL